MKWAQLHGSFNILWHWNENWLYKKGLNDPDNHDGVVTHLEPDILECEGKWALGSITMKKASGGDRILAELFQILKDVKVQHSIRQQIGKLSSGHRTGKGQFSFQSQSKAVPKNYHMIQQFHSWIFLPEGNKNTNSKRCMHLNVRSWGFPGGASGK